jgi:hypothetical protein
MQSNRYISSWILYLHNYSFSTLSMLCGKLQLYFETITELVVTGADSQLVQDAFVSLATNSGHHPLVPLCATL